MAIEEESYRVVRLQIVDELTGEPLDYVNVRTNARSINLSDGSFLEDVIKSMMTKINTVTVSDAKINALMDEHLSSGMHVVPKKIAEAIIGFHEDPRTGVVTFTKYDGSSVQWDTMMEKIALDVELDKRTNEIVFSLQSGKEVRVDVSKFVDVFKGGETENATVSVSSDNEITVLLKKDGVAYKNLSQEVRRYLERSKEFIDKYENKIENIEEKANHYILPPATKNELGGLMTGFGLSADANGVVGTTNILYGDSIEDAVPCGLFLEVTSVGGPSTTPFPIFNWGTNYIASDGNLFIFQGMDYRYIDASKNPPVIEILTESSIPNKFTNGLELVDMEELTWYRGSTTFCGVNASGDGFIYNRELWETAAASGDRNCYVFVGYMNTDKFVSMINTHSLREERSYNPIWDPATDPQYKIERGSSYLLSNAQFIEYEAEFMSYQLYDVVNGLVEEYTFDELGQWLDTEDTIEVFDPWDTKWYHCEVVEEIPEGTTEVPDKTRYEYVTYKGKIRFVYRVQDDCSKILISSSVDLPEELADCNWLEGMCETVKYLPDGFEWGRSYLINSPSTTRSVTPGTGAFIEWTGDEYQMFNGEKWISGIKNERRVAIYVNALLDTVTEYDPTQWRYTVDYVKEKVYYENSSMSNPYYISNIDEGNFAVASADDITTFEIETAMSGKTWANRNYRKENHYATLGSSYVFEDGSYVEFTNAGTYVGELFTTTLETDHTNTTVSPLEFVGEEGGNSPTDDLQDYIESNMIQIHDISDTVWMTAVVYITGNYTGYNAIVRGTNIVALYAVDNTNGDSIEVAGTLENPHPQITMIDQNWLVGKYVVRDLPIELGQSFLMGSNIVYYNENENVYTVIYSYDGMTSVIDSEQLTGLILAEHYSDTFYPMSECTWYYYSNDATNDDGEVIDPARYEVVKHNGETIYIYKLIDGERSVIDNLPSGTTENMFTEFIFHYESQEDLERYLPDNFVWGNSYIVYTVSEGSDGGEERTEKAQFLEYMGARGYEILYNNTTLVSNIMSGMVLGNYINKNTDVIVEYDKAAWTYTVSYSNNMIFYKNSTLNTVYYASDENGNEFHALSASNVTDYNVVDTFGLGNWEGRNYRKENHYAEEETSYLFEDGSYFEWFNDHYTGRNFDSSTAATEQRIVSDTLSAHDKLQNLISSKMVKIYKMTNMSWINTTVIRNEVEYHLNAIVSNGSIMALYQVPETEESSSEWTMWGNVKEPHSEFTSTNDEECTQGKWGSMPKPELYTSYASNDGYIILYGPAKNNYEVRSFVRGSEGTSILNGKQYKEFLSKHQESNFYELKNCSTFGFSGTSYSYIEYTNSETSKTVTVFAYTTNDGVKTMIYTIPPEVSSLDRYQSPPIPLMDGLHPTFPIKDKKSYLVDDGTIIIWESATSSYNVSRFDNETGEEEKVNLDIQQYEDFILDEKYSNTFYRMSECTWYINDNFHKLQNIRPNPLSSETVKVEWDYTVETAVSDEEIVCHYSVNEKNDNKRRLYTYNPDITYEQMLEQPDVYEEFVFEYEDSPDDEETTE